MRNHVGALERYNPETLSLYLTDAEDGKERENTEVFLNNNIIAQIFMTEKPLNIKGISDRSEKVSPITLAYPPHSSEDSLNLVPPTYLPVIFAF